VAFEHRHPPAGHRTLQGDAQTERAGPDHDNIGVHQASVPQFR